MKWMPSIDWSAFTKYLKWPSFGKKSLVRIWRDFSRLVPGEFRSVIRGHRHFLVFGAKGSGKSRLTSGLVEQSQDIYPFEMTWCKRSELQFYLGPKQIIQEVSSETLTDRSIRARARLTRLWRQLFQSREVTAVVAYNPWNEATANLREASREARLIIGKISLLSEICRRPIPLRVVITHMDKVEGYLEFARFLRRESLAFTIHLSTNFKSDAIKLAFESFYERHHSLIIAKLTAEDFLRVQTFFKEVPALLPALEEYLRVLTSRDRLGGPIELEALFLSSQDDPSTSYAPFDWDSDKPLSIFFRYPWLKHQVAASLLFAACSGAIASNYTTDLLYLRHTQAAIKDLRLLRSSAFMSRHLPELDPERGAEKNPYYLTFLPKFFNKQWREAQDELTSHIREQIFEPMLRRQVLDEGADLKTIYLLGLMHATRGGTLGDLVRARPEKWSQMLNVSESLALTYANYNRKQPLVEEKPLFASRVSIDSPLNQLEVWLDFLRELQRVTVEPSIDGTRFEYFTQMSRQLLDAVRQARSDEFVFVVCNHLKAATGGRVQGFERQIDAMGWLWENLDNLENLLTHMQDMDHLAQRGLESDQTVSQLYAQLKSVCRLQSVESRNYRFAGIDEVFTMELSDWNNLAVVYQVEQMLNNFVATHTESKGDVFFTRGFEMSPLKIASSSNAFPHFISANALPGRYTRTAYESCVRSTSEKLCALIGELPIHDEAKGRFLQFLSHEVISYVTEYQRTFEALFQQCGVELASLADFKARMNRCCAPGGSFYDFLKLIRYHTEVFSVPTSCVNNLEQFNTFAFLANIFPEKGEGSEEREGPELFGEFSQLMSELIADLRHDDSGPMSPAARISLAIVQDDPDAYKHRLRTLLKEGGVPEEFHAPFLAPLEHLYTLGVSDLRVAAERLWEEKYEPKIRGVVSLFPFDRSSASRASLEQVEGLLNPKGAFWQEIRSLYGALCTIDGLVWSPMDLGGARVNPAIYRQISQLAAITDKLWDSEGERQPLELRIKGVPFQGGDYKAPIVLSRFIAAGALVPNGNQTPEYQTVKINWWEESPSAVVIELVNRQTKIPFTRDVRTESRLWSFFDLLAKSQPDESDSVTWAIGNSSGEDMRHISFSFESDPWEFVDYRGRAGKEVVCAFDGV